jgi:hypothetical protein
MLHLFLWVIERKVSLEPGLLSVNVFVPCIFAFDMTMTSPLPPSRGSTVEVSIINAGRTTMPTLYLFQNYIESHDVLAIRCNIFLVENKKLNKKVLYYLGFIKDWKEKLPPASELNLFRLICVIYAVSYLQLISKYSP